MSVVDVLRKSPLLILIVSSLTLNAALAARVQRQRGIIKSLTPGPVLKVGDRFGPLTGTTLQGEPATLVPAEHAGLVLYVYTASCGWCVRNANNMRETLNAARLRGMSVYALALDRKGAKEFLDSHSVEASIVVPSDAAKEAYSLGGTPQMLIIGPDGRIVKNWRGAFNKSTAAEVEAYFKISLPGLS